MDFLRRHLSFANVLAAMALFIALGGTSYAATAPPEPPPTVQPEPTPFRSVPAAPVDAGADVGPYPEDAATPERPPEPSSAEQSEEPQGAEGQDFEETDPAMAGRRRRPRGWGGRRRPGWWPRPREARGPRRAEEEGEGRGRRGQGWGSAPVGPGLRLPLQEGRPRARKPRVPRLQGRREGPIGVRGRA